MNENINIPPVVTVEGFLLSKDSAVAGLTDGNWGWTTGSTGLTGGGSSLADDDWGLADVGLGLTGGNWFWTGEFSGWTGEDAPKKIINFIKHNNYLYGIFDYLFLPLIFLPAEALLLSYCDQFLQ